MVAGLHSALDDGLSWKVKLTDRNIEVGSKD